MSKTVVDTSAGKVVTDLSSVVACRDFGDESAHWRGPVGLWLAGALIGVVLFSEGGSDSGEWPELADVDLEAVENAVVAEIDRRGTARTSRVQTHITIDEYRASVTNSLAA